MDHSVCKQHQATNLMDDERIVAETGIQVHDRLRNNAHHQLPFSLRSKNYFYSIRVPGN